MARLDRTGKLGGVGREGEHGGETERPILRQILGLEIASKLGAPKHETDAKFLREVLELYTLALDKTIVYSCMRSHTGIRMVSHHTVSL